MQKKRKRKIRRLKVGNLILLMSVAVLILTMIAGGTIYLFHLIQPGFLRSQNGREAEALRGEVRESEIAVFYPDEESSAGWTDIARQQAEVLFNQLQSTLNQQTEQTSLRVKADYRTHLENGRYCSVIYTIEDDQTQQSQPAGGYVIDMTTLTLVDGSTAFDQAGLQWISAQFRNAMKNREDMKEVAYTLPFIEASAWDSGNFSAFTLEEGMLKFTFRPGVMSEQGLQWELPVSELGEHFLLDAGQSPLPENKVRIAPRTVDSNRPMVALTFDDGPHPTNTVQILEVLQRYDSAATFFMQGFRVEKYPETTLMVINSGSEAASHSYSHPKLTKLSGDSLAFQLDKTTQLVEELTDWQVTIRLFRPPYGLVNDQVRQTSAYPLIMWSIDTLDWKTRDPQQTVDNTLSEVKDGSIVLLHDIHAETVEAVRQLVPALIEQGYQLVTVDEMMRAKGVTLSAGQKVFSPYDIK